MFRGWVQIMKKNIGRKGIVTIILVVTICLVVFDYIRFKKLQLIKQDYSIFSEIEREINKGIIEEISMSDVIPFQWDDIYIIAPYSSDNVIYKTIGSKYIDARSYLNYKLVGNDVGIVYEDSIEKIILLKDGKVIYEENFKTYIYKFDKRHYKNNEVSMMTIMERERNNLISFY